MCEAGSSPTSTVASPSPPPSSATSCATSARIFSARAFPSMIVALTGLTLTCGAMLTLVFSYDARDPEEFERVYGPEGEWTAFFRGGAGYVGTELLRDVE